MAHIKSIKKIYSDGRHSAFTDMETWKGRYYVTFRNGGGHARPGDYGDVLVIRSRDLVAWEVCARLSAGEEHDDHHLEFEINELEITTAADVLGESSGE